MRFPPTSVDPIDRGAVRHPTRHIDVERLVQHAGAVLHNTVGHWLEHLNYSDQIPLARESRGILESKRSYLPICLRSPLAATLG